MKITKDIKIVSAGGITDLFDNHIKSIFNITDEEYDFIAENALEEEWDILFNDKPSFSQRREMIKIRSKYLKLYEEQTTT